MRGLIGNEAVDGAASRKRASVVHLGGAQGSHGERGLGDLVGLGHGAGVVAHTGDRNGDIAGDVGEVVLVVRDRVVLALDKGVALGIHHHGEPLVLLAVVDGVGRVVDRDALEGIGVLGIGDDGLGGNRQGAVDVRDVVVVNLRGLARSGDKRVLTGSNNSLGAGDLVCQGLPCHESLPAGDGDVRLLVLGQRNAVVDLGAVGGGQGDGAPGDGQLVVDDYELDLGEVGVRVSEVGGLQLHLVGACVSAAHGGVAGEGEVGLRVQRVGGHKVVALGRLLGAVVRIGAAALGDGDDDLAGGRRHLEGALVLSDGVVVGPEARELGVGDGVGYRALFHLGHGASGAHVGDLAGDEALVAGLLPAADLGQAVGLAVIGPGLGAGGELNLALEDLVGHLGRAGIVALAGDGHGHGASVGDVGAVGELVVGALDQRLVAVLDDGLLRLLGAVVHDVGQGVHGHAVVLGGLDALGRDGQGAVHDHEGDLGEAGARVLEVVGLELHVVGAGVGAAHGRIAGELEVGLRVERVGGGEVVALDRLLGAVVVEGAAVLGDSDDDLGVISGDDELAEGARDEVVLVKRAFVQRVGELVEALAGKCLRTGDVVGRTLAVDKASAADGHVRLSVPRERGAIVGLGSTCRGQEHGTHGHANLLGGSGVLALGVVGPRGAQLNGRAVAHVRCGDGSRVAQPGLAVETVLNGQGVAVLVPGACPVSRKRSAVVHLLDVAGVPRNAVCVDLATLDGELAVFDDELDIGEVNVGVGELPLNETHGVGALSGALCHSLAGEGEVALLVQGVGDGRDGVAGHGLLGAVVGLRLAVALDGDGDLVGNGRHVEDALVLSDGVVVGPEARELGVGDGVGHLAIGHGGHGAGGAHVGDLAGDEALVAGLLPAANLGQAVGLAVVGPGLGSGGQVHLALEDLVGHVELACVVALAGDGHGHGAGVGDVGAGLVGAVGELVVDTLDERLVAVLDDGGLALGLAVVHDVGKGAHGHAVVLGGLDALGRDGQGAVLNHEGDLGEAGARVLEVAGLELHLVGAGVGAAHTGVTGELEVGLRVERVGGVEVVALDRLLGAVVAEGAAVLGDGDDDLGVVGGDDELAVLGRHQVVGRVRALVELIGEGVVALAHCGLRAGDSDSRALAVDKADALALRGGGDGTVGERSAVVRLVGVLRGKRDETLGDGDALGAGGVLALGVVGAGRTEHDGLMAEVREVDLIRVAHPRLAVINAVLNLEGVTVLVGRARFVGGKRISVIDLLFVLGAPVDAVDVDLAARNGEATVIDDELDVREVVARVGELVSVEAHVIRANNSTLGHGRTRELDIGLGIGGVVRDDGIAGHHLFGAVVGLRLAVARDGDGDLVGDGRHLEGAVVRGESVVAGLGVSVELVRESIFNFAHVGDRGRVRERRALAFSKAGDGLHLMLGVRGSVVGPLARSGSHSDLSLVDDECAILGINRELVGHNIAVAIGHNGGAGNVVGVLASVNLARVLGRKARDGVRDAVDNEGISLDTCCLMSLAVVGGSGRVRLDRDLVLGVAARDREGALGLVDDVVVGVGALVQRVRECVRRATHNSLRAREGVRGTLARCPAGLSLKRGATVDKRGTVVLLGKIGRLEGDLRPGNTNIAVGHFEHDIRKVGSIAVGELVGLEAHDGQTSVSALRLGGTREDNLVLGVELVVGREGIPRGTEFLAVIDALFMVADDGDNDRGLHGVDREGALVGRDGVVVGVGTLGQRIGERIVRFTSIELGTGDAVGRTLAHDKAVAGDGDLALDQSRAVVGLGGGGGRQRDFALLDGDRAVLNNLKRHVGEVVVDVLELLGLEAHDRGAGVGALGARRILECKVDIRLCAI